MLPSKDQAALLIGSIGECRVALVAVRTLDNAAGTLLQYLETVAAMPEAHQDPLVLAVIRALGRYASGSELHSIARLHSVHSPLSSGLP